MLTTALLRAHVRTYVPTRAMRWLQDTFVYHPVMRGKGIGAGTSPVTCGTPDTVFFEVRTRCNGHCAFCAAAVDSDTRDDRRMPAELHEKVLRELAANGWVGRIAYHNNSEPLIFKELPEFVRRAKEIIPDAFIQILSNGRSLTTEKARALLRAGIDELAINYYFVDTTSPLPQVFWDVADKVLPDFFRPDEVDIVGLGARPASPNARFFYRVTRRLENQVLTSRAGTAPNKPIPDGGPRGFCQYPWTQFIVSADGRVPMCCCDLNISEPFGSVSTEGVADVWNGKAAQRIRKTLLRGDRKQLANCSRCDFYGVKKPPNTYMGRLIFWLTR